MSVARLAVAVSLPQLFDYKAENVTAADLGRCVTVPFASGVKTGVILALEEASELPLERLKSIAHIDRALPALDEHWRALFAFACRYYHAPPGDLLTLALPAGVRDAAASIHKDPDPWLALTEAGQAASRESARPSRARSLLTSLLAQPLPARKSALRALPDGAALGELLRRGWLAVASAPAPLGQLGDQPALTDEQRGVLTTICDALASARFAPFLLFGVTGSGKTEIYLRAIEHALAAGRQALMLVPEIGLTPQLHQRVAQRFPAARIVSLHSALSPGERARNFLAAWQGRADIILGTRLAVFTPLPRLGLIVVDEEHDASYKQQETVRYCARDLAVWRARNEAVPIVLGSATPSLESWRQAEAGRYQRLTLAHRAHRAARLPAVRLLDIRRQPLMEGCSAELLAAIETRLARGEQTLVFLNRRGYAPVLSCPACGWVSQCPHCSAKRVLHLAERRLCCHHCGFSVPVERACPDCGNQDLQALGRGTQRVEAALAAHFSAARVLRIDRDSARTRRAGEELLARVASGEADILIGTQMLAKGHDFPRLTLVGILGADATLHAADFRAPERLFQQLMQVGGRAGRADVPGEVLIQTAWPAHPLYQHLLRHDYPAFAAAALAERRAAVLPPHGALALLYADAPELAAVTAFLQKARELAQNAAAAFPPGQITIHGIVSLRLARLAGRERAQFLIESPARAPLQTFLNHWLPTLRRLRQNARLRWHIDVDPQEI